METKRSPFQSTCPIWWNHNEDRGVQLQTLPTFSDFMIGYAVTQSTMPTLGSNKRVFVMIKWLFSSSFLKLVENEPEALVSLK